MNKKKNSILLGTLMIGTLSIVGVTNTAAEDIVDIDTSLNHSEVNSPPTTSDVNVADGGSNSTVVTEPVVKTEPIVDTSQEMKEIEKLKTQIELINETKTTTNEELKSVLDSINQVEKELSIILSEVARLSVSIADKKEAIATLQGNLATLEKEIKIAESKVEEQKKVLGSSLSFLYENKDSGFFQLFFQSENLTDFIKSIDFMNLMIDSNDEIFNELVELQESLLVKKGAYEKDLKSLNTALAELNRDVQELEEKQAAQQVLLEQNKEAEAQKMNEIEQQEAHIDELNQRISTILSSMDTANSGDTDAPLAPDQKLMVPLKVGSYYVSSLYGYRIHPVYGYSKLHNGIDLAAAFGTPIYAVGNGTVVDAGKATGYGNWIVIRHDNGLYSIYGHMENGTLYVKAGDRVYQGQLISKVGNAGTSTGAHLHLSIAKNYSNGKFTYIDPLLVF